MTFTADSTGLPPDAVYEWTFGDGTTAAGRVVTHVFEDEGAFQVGVRARAGTPRAQSSVTVTSRSLDASWSHAGGPAGFGFGFPLVQRGETLEGDIVLTSLCWLPIESIDRWPPGTVRGRVVHPRTVTWTLDCSGVWEFSGTVSPDLESITGVYAGRRNTVTYWRDRWPWIDGSRSR